MDQGKNPSTNEEILQLISDKLRSADWECGGSNPAICDLIDACQGLKELLSRLVKPLDETQTGEK